MNSLPIILYHDTYETNMGDGFYPSVDPAEGTAITILFHYKLDYWYQDSNSKYCITSLHTNSYYGILEYMNAKCQKKAVGIKNKYDNDIKVWSSSFD